MRDPRKQKIFFLKKRIKRESKKLLKYLRRSTKTKEGITDRRISIHSLEAKLSFIRMNKNSSSAFEWFPTPPNRSARRAAKKLKRV